MTEREKKLLILMGGTLFMILNLIALNKFYLPKVQAAETEKLTAEGDLNRALGTLTLEDEYIPQMNWLDRAGMTMEGQVKARSELQQFLRQSAERLGLIVVDTDIVGYQEGQYFGRVKVSCRVTGEERNAISWLESIHRIKQGQVITKLEIKPMNSDLKKIDIKVEVEKWIIPPDEV